MLEKKIERERITIPEIGESTKFVQFYVKGEPYLRCWKNSGMPLHSKILEDALKNEFQLEYEEKSPGVPEPYGKDYEIAGAGEVARSENELSFFGNSRGYRCYPDKEHLKKIRDYFPKGIEIKIDGERI